MAEAETIEILQLTRYQITFIVTQIIVLHFAIIVGIHVFLRNAHMSLKLAAFAVYTIGFLMLFGMLLIEIDTGVAAVEELRSISQTEPLSEIGLTSLSVFDGYVSFMLMANYPFWLLLWVGTLYFMFFDRHAVTAR